MTEIALFPIPNCITFPGTVFPLHVFEPRYRKMVSDCIEQQRLLGICHTQKELHSAKENQTIQETLQSNQATYKPYPVFSAGSCELIKTLEDGRLYLQVNVSERFSMIAEKQTLPYVIAECELYQDNSSNSEQDEAEIYQEKIIKRLVALTKHIPKVGELLMSSEWKAKDPLAFSFEIFGLLDFEPEYLQQVLEMRSPVERLDFLLANLNKQ